MTPQTERSMRAHPEPDRDTLMAAIEAGTRKPDVCELFGLTPKQLSDLQVRYQLPKFKSGPPKGALYAAKWKRTAPKTELDRLCDRAVQRRRRRTLLYGFLLLEWCARQDPVRDPVGWQLGDNWDEQALCRGLDPGLFTHPDTRRADWAKAAAKAICAACPVRDVCPANENALVAKPKRRRKAA